MIFHVRPGQLRPDRWTASGRCISATSCTTPITPEHHTLHRQRRGSPLPPGSTRLLPMPLELAETETRAWLMRARAGLGGSGIRELIGQHRSAAACIEAARRESRVAESARAWLAAPDADLIDGDLRWLQMPQHHLIVCTSEDFPTLLRDIPAAPAALFVAGDPTCLWSPQIAIVGSRSATGGGLANARAFAKAFASQQRHHQWAGRAWTAQRTRARDGRQDDCITQHRLDLVYPSPRKARRTHSRTRAGFQFPRVRQAGRNFRATIASSRA